MVNNGQYLTGPPRTWNAPIRVWQIFVGLGTPKQPYSWLKIVGFRPHRADSQRILQVSGPEKEKKMLLRYGNPASSLLLLRDSQAHISCTWGGKQLFSMVV